jgi:hypothetical protein
LRCIFRYDNILLNDPRFTMTFSGFSRLGATP